MEKVIVEHLEDELYHVINEAGQIIEPDFNTYEEGYKWAEDNGYQVVETFNV